MVSAYVGISLFLFLVQGIVSSSWNYETPNAEEAVDGEVYVWGTTYL